MKKFYLTFLFSVLLCTSYAKGIEKRVAAEETDTTNGWKRGIFFSSAFSQVKLSNWAAGGNNSTALNSLLSVYVKYRHNELTWDNNLDLAYGFISQNKKSVKSDDRIDFASKLGKETSKTSPWYYTLLLGFKTQFARGYNYPNDSVVISNFLAPAYVMLALGMDYKKYQNFSFFVSPLSGKFTYVKSGELADQGAYGVQGATYDTAGNVVTHGKHARYEIGGYVKMSFTKDIMQNVNLMTKLELFSNYLHNPENVDVFWDVILTMKINRYLSANISTNLIYDDDVHIITGQKINGIDEKIGPRVQFKEIFGVGLSCKF